MKSTIGIRGTTQAMTLIRQVVRETQRLKERSVNQDSRVDALEALAEIARTRILALEAAVASLTQRVNDLENP